MSVQFVHCNTNTTKRVPGVGMIHHLFLFYDRRRLERVHIHGTVRIFHTEEPDEFSKYCQSSVECRVMIKAP